LHLNRFLIGFEPGTDFTTAAIWHLNPLDWDRLTISVLENKINHRSADDRTVLDRITISIMIFQFLKSVGDVTRAKGCFHGTTVARTVAPTVGATGCAYCLHHETVAPIGRATAIGWSSGVAQPVGETVGATAAQLPIKIRPRLSVTSVILPFVLTPY
jgi:hypothetical protein